MTNRNYILTLLVMFYQETVWTMDISRSVLLCFEKLTGKDGGWCNSTIVLCNTGIAQSITINVTFINNFNDNQCRWFCGTNHEPVMSNDIHNLSEKCLRMECNMTNFKIPSNPNGNGNSNGFVNVTYSCTDNTAIVEEADNITTSTPRTILTSINSQVTTITTGTLSTTTLTSASTSSGPTTILSTASTGRGSTHMITRTTIENYTTPIKTSTASTGSSSTQRGDSTTAIGNSMTPIENNTAVGGTTQIVESTTSIGQSTEPTSPPNELSVAQIRTAIAVSVVFPVIIAVVVVAVMMYRRGKCKLPFFKCTERCDNHSLGMADTYAMSSTANADPTYDFSRDVDVILCNVDYSEIHKVRKETDSEYNHVNLKMKQAVLDPTYNHIGHFNSSSGDTEQTYNIVGDETSQKTDSSTLQRDMYSHIGAMAKPASGHLVEDSYAHINGVIKNTSTSNERNHYDIAVLQSNCGPTEGVGNQDRKMKSSKEKTLIVVGPSNVDSNNEAPVSHSYFILEKHEKET